MTFLEAKRIVRGFQGGDALAFTLAMSGAADTLDLFLRAAGAKRGRAVNVRTLPFNTMGQQLASPAVGPEVWLLLPWDFAPELDWRSGLPADAPSAADIADRAREMAQRLDARRGARLIYLPAPTLPLFADPAANAALASGLLAHAQRLGAAVLPADAFALGTYLASGNPIGATSLGRVAETVIAHALDAQPQSKKLLVTDFDNVLWAGVVGEDGTKGLGCSPEGPGYRHFIYQTLLVALKREGVLLAGVSRNDETDARAPFVAEMTTVRADDFVTILASYHPKSAQVRMLAEGLNLGLDAVVFVDDNPIELAEVEGALPAVTCLEFPGSDDRLPPFVEQLRQLFARRVVTDEDRERTALYRRRAEGLAPAAGAGTDLRDFLRGLGMKLTIHDRTPGSRDRALQLINKTNQFNINGRRLSEDELRAHLEAGARLYTASLDDRTGSHGEILSCLVTRGGIVESLVLSCRVFQRRVEHAFLNWLATHDAPRAFRFLETPRNEPARMFFEDPAFRRDAGDLVAFDARAFAERHRDDAALLGVAAA